MPCRDYSDDVRVVDNTQTYKTMRDKLARIACKAMTRLEGLGILCKDDKEMYEWFQQHKVDDAKALADKKKLEKAEAERKRIHREQERQREVALLKKLQAKYGGTV